MLHELKIQQTLGLIKPDAIRRRHIGRILSHIEQALDIEGMYMTALTIAQAKQFYLVHAEQAFYQELCDYMSEGKILAMCLSGVDAIAKYRQIMGATDPSKASEGSLRKLFGQSIGHNAVHGSDSPETAKHELSFFFDQDYRPILNTY